MIHTADGFVPNLFTPTEEHQMLREQVRVCTKVKTWTSRLRSLIKRNV